jgi:hypothetical protein
MYTDAVVLAASLCLGAIAVLAGVGLVVWLLRGPQEPTSTAAPLDHATLMAQARELGTHADAAAQRAAEAQAEVEAAHDGLAEADRALAQAEEEYDVARQASAAARQEVRAGAPEPPSPDARARHREVSRAALAAYRRGDLSVDELRTVFHRAGDWDPVQEQRERDAERLASRERCARRGYERAAAAARAGRERLHIADVAAAAFMQEAVDAAVEAQEAQAALDESARSAGG